MIRRLCVICGKEKRKLSFNGQSVICKVCQRVKRKCEVCEYMKQLRYYSGNSVVCARCEREQVERPKLVITSTTPLNQSCKRCKLTKSVTEFSTNKGKPITTCRVCLLERIREGYAKSKQPPPTVSEIRAGADVIFNANMETNKEPVPAPAPGSGATIAGVLVDAADLAILKQRRAKLQGVANG